MTSHNAKPRVSVGDRDAPTADADLAELELALWNNDLRLDNRATTDGLVCSGLWVRRFIVANSRPMERTSPKVVWAGTCMTDLVIDNLEVENDPATDPPTIVTNDASRSVKIGTLDIAGSIHGNLYVARDVRGDLIVGGVAHHVYIVDTIAGSLNIKGAMHHLTFWGGAVVQDDVQVSGDVDSGIDFWGSSHVGRDVTIWPSSHVGGTVKLLGDATIGRNLNINGVLGGHLGILDNAEIGRNLSVRESGGTEGGIVVNGLIRRNLNLSGVAGEGVWINGSVAGVSRFMPQRDGYSIKSLRGARFEEQVFLGDGVDLTACDFSGFADFEKLRLVGGELFGRGSRKHVGSADGDGNKLPLGELEAIYRRLRKKLEVEGNRPASSDFYYHEMEARRKGSQGFMRGLLELYRIVSCYGTRALPAFGWLIGIMAVAALGIAAGGWDPFDCDTTLTCTRPSVHLTSGWSNGERVDVALFVAKSAVSFISPPRVHLSRSEEAIQLALRFLGPVLLAQVVLGVRDRVARQ